jgi:hypothetical protein
MQPLERSIRAGLVPNPIPSIGPADLAENNKCRRLSRLSSDANNKPV